MGELGAAGQVYQPDSEWGALADQILQQGAAQQAGNTLQPIRQLVTSGCSASSEGQVCH